jgi:serine/threonine-protein kinase
VAAGVPAQKVCTTCGARHPADALFCPADGTPLVLEGVAHAKVARATESGQDPYVGRELAGHIDVRQLAGVGAMGRVYRAFQRGIDRDVAVKILHRELSANAAVVARFHREAKVASRLLHPNVVQVHLAGQLPDGALYIVMEYLDGLSLQSALAAAGGALPLPRALHVALQICDAVGEAHAQGIVHRDLKPENVMLVHRGADADFVKVLDFGIARLDSGEQSMATAQGLIFGTARYISPEGAQGEAVTPPSDVYSLATLTYQMLAGRTPFEADQAVAMLVQQIHDPPPPLRSIPRAAYVPEPIADVIMANLAKDKAKRAPDARAMGRALLDAAKTAGLSPEDLVPRSILLGARAGVVQLPSMQRTRQLQLDRIEGTEQLRQGGASASGERVAAGGTEIPAESPTRTAYETPGEPTPAPALATNDANRTAALPKPPNPGATQKWTPPPAVAAQLQAAVPVPTPAPSGAIPPAPISSVDITMDDASAPPLPVHTARIAATPAPATLETPPRPDARAPLPPTAIDEGASSGASSRANRVALVALFVLVGVGVAGGVTIRMRGLAHDAEAPAASAPAPLPPPIALTSVPPAPPAPVVATSDAGLAVPGAVAGAHTVPSAGDGSKGAAAAPGAYRTTLDVFPAKPRVGQAVDLVVKLASSAGASRKPAEDAHFVITGSAIGGDGAAKLPAFEDATGVFRAGFTFLAAGKYEVTFHATVDGVAVKSARSVVTSAASQAPAPLPAPSAGTDDNPPPPAPSGSVKWL